MMRFYRKRSGVDGKTVEFNKVYRSVLVVSYLGCSLQPYLPQHFLSVQFLHSLQPYR